LNIPKDQRPPLPNGPGHGRTKGAKSKLTRERVERELRYLALSDPKALFDRVAKGKREFKLREIHAMSEEMRRCIASVKVRTENLSSGDDAQDTTVEVRLWDKTKALELCARALGMLKDVHVHEWDEAQLSMLDDWKKGNRNE
jgi:hypothetical protein